MATKKAAKGAKLNIRPLGDKVLVRSEEEEERTAGGIILPDTAKKKPTEGTVIAIGTGKKTEDGKVIPLTVKVGDKVIYSKYGGTEILIGGEEFLILDEDQIYAIKE
jgi:chaperonin GroES